MDRSWGSPVLTGVAHRRGTGRRPPGSIGFLLNVRNCSLCRSSYVGRTRSGSSGATKDYGLTDIT
jgi:hypothetical protein